MLMFQMFHVTMQSESDLISRQTPTQRVVELRVRAPEEAQNVQRTPLNLSLVIDRSGSMHGMKLDFVKQAEQHVVDLLSNRDRVSVVSFDDEVRVDSASSVADIPSKGQIKERISTIQSGGSTNLAGGWTQGCQQVAANAESDRQVNRVLLLTDGLANVGIIDPEALTMHARELAQRGVSTSTFGVGQGFNEHLLEGMANNGSGNFYYISSPQEIPSIFMREFKEIASVTARDVTVELTIPEHTAAEVLGGWSYTQVDNHLQLKLGDLTGGREQTIYLKLLLPPSEDIQSLVINASATGTGLHGKDLADEAQMRFRYASAAELAAAPVAQDVLERYAMVEMSDKTTAALKLERNDQREQARKQLQQALEENRPNMPADQARYYEDMAERMAVGMAEGDRKNSQYMSYLRKRGREDQK